VEEPHFIFPKRINLDITNVCNFNCLTCSCHSPYSKPDSFEHLPGMIFEKLIPYIKKATVVNIVGGGEPLIAPNILTTLDHIRKINPTVYMYTTTNASMLKDLSFIWKTLQALSEIRISILGFKKNYDRLMLGGHFEELTETLKMINQVRPMLDHPVKVTINFPLFRSNCEDLIPLTKYLGRHHIDELNITVFRVFHEQLRNEAIRENPDFRKKLEKIFSQVEKICRKSSILLNNANTPKERCSRPWEDIIVSVKGKVSLCCLADTTIGDLNTQTIEEIWNGEELKKYRQGLLAGIPYKECSLCNESLLKKDPA
jgi:MoaA/NifB/PqqE/SkfB family radical SAM enzyme